MATSLPVVNLSEATFECIYGRGCDGLCCQNGRPGVYPEEVQRLDANLSKFLPELRPEARQTHRIERLPEQPPQGRPADAARRRRLVRLLSQGLRAAQGRRRRGRQVPLQARACALFPLAKNDAGEWYVRQWGVEGEEWDIFCLNPQASPRPAAESLQEEIRLAEQYTAEQAAAK